MTLSAQTSQVTRVSGIAVPDTKLANEITEFVRDTESTLLFNHSSRVYYFGALAGQRRGLKFDAELLYAGAMFHDMGLVPAYSSDADRFEVDGANAARATSSAVITSLNRISTTYGRRLHFTRLPASLSTCIRSLLL